MLDSFIIYIALIVVILFLVMIARKLRIAYPVLLVIAGLLISIIPGMPVLSINPHTFSSFFCRLCYMKRHGILHGRIYGGGAV
jgi:CPA1 family monovalent cation:H+ antiporter